MRILSCLSLAAMAFACAASANPGGSPPPRTGGTGWGAGGWNGAPVRGTMPIPPVNHPPVAAGQLPPPGHPPVMHGGHGGRKGRWYGGWRGGGSDYRFIPGGPFGGGYYYWPQPQVYYSQPAYSYPAYDYAPPPPPAPPGPPRVYTNPTGPITVPAGTTVIVKVTPQVTKTVAEEWVYPKAKKSHWRGSKTKLRAR